MEAPHTGADFARYISPVARRLLGKPNKHLSNRSQLRFGRNGSVAVDIAGDKAGTWFDHEGGRGGGVLDLLRAHTGLHGAAAIEWLRAEVEADIPDNGRPATARPPAEPREPAPHAERTAPKPREDAGEPARPRLVATYDYLTANGELQFQVCRMEPKTFRQRRPDPDEPGKWLWTVKGLDLVPYRLPELLAADPKEPVFVVEGEKDVDALWARGLVATCNAAGAGKWYPACTDALRGRRVVVLPDNDPQARDPAGNLRWHEDGRPVLPGQDHAAMVAERIKGVAKSVQVLPLPGLPEKGDVSDWLAAGGTAEALRAMAAPAQPAGGADPLPLLWFDEITPVLEAKDFVQGVLAEAGAAVIYGESNAGKTFWTTDLALHVAVGKEWCGRRVEQGGVIYCAMEGGHAFRNRVTAWARHHTMERVSIPFAAVPVMLNLSNPEADTPRLIQAIKAGETRMGQPVKLVVIDTLSRAMAGGNENAPDDMGALVAAMDAVRAATQACVLFVHHSGKDAAKGARGHSLLRAAIDTEIEVKADEASGIKTATIVKQRDMAKGAAFGFQLVAMVLGQNQHGEDVTTCVVEPAEARQAASGGGKRLTLTETERGWLNDLVNMLLEPEAAVERVPASGMGAILTLTREQVRRGYRDRGRFASGADANLTGADRERMRSMLNKLKDKGKIGMTADLVWVA